MKDSPFQAIPCGENIPSNNIHSVFVSIPTLCDVIAYEENCPKISEKITIAYPRFVLHPYLKKLSKIIHAKYEIPSNYDVLIINCKNQAKIINSKYNLCQTIIINEPFGVILINKETPQLKSVLTYIQHVGCTLSSRHAEDYLHKYNAISTKYEETIESIENSEKIILKTLSQAYKQKQENIFLSTSGMNSIYATLMGLKTIQKKQNRTIMVQLGWVYLDTMNIVEQYFEENKIFLDVNQLDKVENYLKHNGLKVSAIITELPTNPLLQCVDLERLKKLCDEYDIPLIIDSTLTTPYNLNLNKYADILIESLTKFASGNADVLMGCCVLNEKSKLSLVKNEFLKHTTKPYIRDIQRLAFSIKNYQKRVKISSQNTIKLLEYFESCSYIDKVYHCMQKENKDNYSKLMISHDSYTAVISLTFNKPFSEIYDKLNFAKGPSLGTEFTLLSPYIYLAHYDYINTKDGQDFLAKNNMPIDLLRVSVGCENIEDIISEFKRLE